MVVFGIVVAAVVGLIAAVAAAGVSRSDEPTGLSATIEQTTAFQARGLLEVLVSNRSDRPLEIVDLRLVDDRFETVDPTERDARIEPGPRRVMMPVPFGPPRCGDDAPPTGTGAPVIEVNGDVDVPVDADGEEFLTRLHERQCGQQRVRETVEVSFTGPFDDIGDATVGVELRLDRLSGGARDTVRLEGMRGTVVFTVVTPGPGALVTLEPDDRDGSVPIVVSASRCDAHALIESKKSYRFPMWISVGEADARYLEVEPTGEARTVLERVLQEGCF